MRSTFEAWLTADMFFLQDGNEDLLKILADLAPQVDNAVLTPEIKIEQQKKRLSYFLVLNPFYSYFYALNSMNASKEMREKFKNQ